MVRLGNFLFRFRNGLFPVAYLLLFSPSPRLCQNYGVAWGVGLGIALVGQALRALTIGLAYIVRGGKNRQVYAEGLVQEGIFAHCRNPLYTGNVLILAGLGLMANSLVFIVIGLPLFLVAYAAIIAAEENYLRHKFGREFDHYCGRVPRIVPHFRGLNQTLGSMHFHWRRLMVKEYGSTYAWTAGAILLTLKTSWFETQAGPRGTLATATLLASLASLTILYAIARYLKKSRIVRAD